MKRTVGSCVLLLLIIAKLNAQTTSPSEASKQEVKDALGVYTQDSGLLRIIDDDCYCCQQLKCMMGEVKECDILGATIKGIAQLMLKNDCLKCQGKEREIFNIVKRYFSQRFPTEWTKILTLYA
ncbi:Hypothetical predicted protein [Cloeon dipterum]|uniref:Uncharacterized protein n=1 Tax=Cloeon dipterum TaxID=197152 RepID=A0A8S1D859_9INSE|nr:Hypothetical predicted protein [Cloeon dipterum]